MAMKPIQIQIYKLTLVNLYLDFVESAPREKMPCRSDYDEDE